MNRWDSLIFIDSRLRLAEKIIYETGIVFLSPKDSVGRGENWVRVLLSQIRYEFADFWIYPPKKKICKAFASKKKKKLLGLEQSLLMRQGPVGVTRLRHHWEGSRRTHRKGGYVTKEQAVSKTGLSWCRERWGTARRGFLSHLCDWMGGSIKLKNIIYNFSYLK